MRIHIQRRVGSAGSALVFTILLMGLVTILVGSYMTLVQNQNRSTMRSQAWNSTVPLIEAGIEEAMAHLNHNGITNLGKDGWAAVGGRYVKRREIGEGFYLVGISNYGSQAVIFSQGYVNLPGMAAVDPGVVVASTGFLLGDSHIGRGVEVLAKTEALFSKGLVAKGKIDLKGNDIATDSFDSSDSAYSTSGQYDATRTKDNGDIATNGGVVNVGNANVKGVVSTGPGGAVEIGAAGTVGSAEWHDSGKTGIEPGYFKDDMNVSFPVVEAPSMSGADLPTSGTDDGETVQYLLSGGKYQMSELSMSSDETMVVTGDSVLYVTGDVSLSGSASIVIKPGGSLTLYVGGERAVLSGGGVVNETGTAAGFYYYGLPSNTQVEMVGNGEFVGSIYAPNAGLYLSGGGREVTDLIGSAIAKAITLNGHFNFHYDEALAKYGPPRAYVITSWEEMHPEDLTTLEVAILNQVNLDVQTLDLNKTTDLITTDPTVLDPQLY